MISRPATKDPPEWTDRLVYDVALALEGGLPDLAPVVARNGLSPDDFVALLDDPVFLRAVLTLREEIAAKGVVFQTRARSLAEDVLRTTHKLSRDADVSPTVRHDCAKSIVRWAGYDKPDPTDGLNGNSGVTISINIGGSHDHRSVTLNSHGAAGEFDPSGGAAPHAGLDTDDDRPVRLLPKMPDSDFGFTK